jgi:transcriptional regulator with XRE-family HTH domain
MTEQSIARWIPEDTFGDRLRRIRRHLKLSQGEFSARIGEGEKALASWEAGNREPRSAVAVAKRIELAFGVPAAWVLGLEMPTAPGPDGPEGVPSQLPRLDSNQEPSGYRSSHVTTLRSAA